ncbi:MAG: hypothetical protein H6732_08255 [Alphaproteobacteria bacterium]|nr:hypothetical protein [Alphaproteobacteria bacterium]
MLPLLLTAALSLPAHAEEPRKGSWFKDIRYEVGVGLQAGGGIVGTLDQSAFTLELAAFELRSFFTPKVAWHTTLNVQRMLTPAIAKGQGRLDYDLHVGGHLPVAPRTKVVVAPGASIAYGFAGSTYQRFVGDVRVGLDLLEASERWSVGVYLRPFVGWMQPEAVLPGGTPSRAGVTAGALAEAVFMARIPTRAERRARKAAEP